MTLVLVMLGFMYPHGLGDAVIVAHLKIIAVFRGWQRFSLSLIGLNSDFSRVAAPPLNIAQLTTEYPGEK